MTAEQIIEALRGSVPEGAVEAYAAADGMPAMYVAREHLTDVAFALRDLPALQFALAVDITGVDFFPREPRFEVMFHLVSLGVAGYGDTPKRLRVKVKVPGDDPRLPTIIVRIENRVWIERPPALREVM